MKTAKEKQQPFKLKYLGISSINVQNREGSGVIGLSKDLVIGLKLGPKLKKHVLKFGFVPSAGRVVIAPASKSDGQESAVGISLFTPGGGGRIVNRHLHKWLAGKGFTGRHYIALIEDKNMFVTITEDEFHAMLKDNQRKRHYERFVAEGRRPRREPVFGEYEIQAFDDSEVEWYSRAEGATVTIAAYAKGLMPDLMIKK